MNKGLEERIRRTEWFRHDRLGMFIHWGLYAIPGRGEWVMSEERIPAQEYEKYKEQFDPADYDPQEWMRLAKEAGMKYVVMTAKHHDGFCLFDSAYTDYKSTNCAGGRDLIAEYTEAARAQGLKVGIYYSLLDWHHPDFPKYGDLNHPMRGNEAFREEKIDFDNYLRYLHGQVKELCTRYGRLDLLWFDYSYENMRGETWKAGELVEMVRSFQPDVIIDNRLETSGEGFGSIVTDCPAVYSGDFASPEQIIPPEGIRNSDGDQVPWELCTTMNNNWGYNPTDLLYKEPSMLIRKLVECVSKGGNMILNVGPDARGRLNRQSVETLKALGAWMERNAESIVGCGRTDIPKPEWGRYTGNGNVIYAHVMEQPVGPIAFTGIDPEKVISMRRLADGAEVKNGASWVTSEYQHILFGCLGDVPHYSYPLPDPADTVIKIVCKDA